MDNKLQNMIESFKKHMTCHLCNSILVKPIKYQNCQHSFCKKCLSNIADNKLCPQCGLNSDKSIVEDEILNKFIQFWYFTCSKRKMENDIIDKMKDFTKLSEGIKDLTVKRKHFRQVASDREQNKRKKTLDISISKLETSVQKASKSTTINEKNIEKRNSKGETRLHEACVKGNFEQVQALLNLGATPNTKDNAGWTPLQEASDRGLEKIVKLLLENGANPNIPGYENSTALHMAVVNNHLIISKLLIDYGSNVDAKNIYNITPKVLAKTESMQEILNIEPDPESLNNDFSLSQYMVVPKKKFSKIVLYCPDLQNSKIEKLMRIINSSSAGMTRSFKFDKLVTHVIVKTNDDLLCDLNIAVLLALLSGKWIISDKWIDEEGDMEEFEVQGLLSFPQTQAAKRSRISHMNQLPGLFSGCHIYFWGPLTDAKFGSMTLSRYLLNLFVEYGEGVLLKREPNPEVITPAENTRPYHINSKSCLEKCSHYIIYRSDIPEPILKYNMPHVKSLPLQWMIDCIANYKLIEPW